MNIKNKIFVSYASTDAEIARRIVNCLKNSYPELWFDELEIAGGDNVVLKINAGLVDSLMGIPILSDNFFQRRMTHLELSAMIVLVTNEQFRIWPLLHGMSHRELVRRFPILAAIRVDSADEECNNLRSKFGMAFNITEQAINVKAPISAILLEFQEFLSLSRPAIMFM